MKTYQTFILDIDGTLIRGDEVLPGAKELLILLRQQQKQIILATNNPADSHLQIFERLMKMGLLINKHEIVTPIDAINDFLEAEEKVETVFTLANRQIKDKIVSLGWQAKSLDELKKGEDISHVLVAMSQEITYAHFAKALQSLDAGASLVGLNADLYCPIKEGRAPDTGSLLAVLERPTGMKAMTMGNLLIG